MKSRWRWGALVAMAAGACGGTTALSPGVDAGEVADAGAAAPHDATVDAGNGDTTDATDDSTTAADVTEEPRPTPPYCPSAPPTVGVLCPHTGADCEYGTSNDRLCNTIYSCTSGRWVKSYDAIYCNFNGTNDPACPATYAEGLTNGPCAITSACEFPEGRCACVHRCGGLRNPDGGSLWVCGRASQGCPVIRGTNELGTPCATPGLVCDYDGCCNSTSQTCGEAGVWEDLTSPPCP
jgi:hypothetical protein